METAEAAYQASKAQAATSEKQVQASKNQVSYSTLTAPFSGIITILGTDNDKEFNEPGDSGSLVLTDPGRYITAIVFAKHNQYCWALPFSLVLPLLDHA